MKTVCAIIIILFKLAAGHQEAQAQIVWKHKTSDVWLSADSTVDSSICFTSLSCFQNICTAAAVVHDNPLHPIGRITFFRSNDGGNSWNEQITNVADSPDIATFGITKLQQIDSFTTIGIGNEGVIVHTTDGGTTWKRRDCPASRLLSDIHFSDPLTGILVCAGSDSNLFTTIDGGAHWINHPSSAGNLSCHSYGGGKFRFYKYGHGPVFTTNDDFKTIDSTAEIMDSIADPKYRYVFSRCDFGKDDLIIAHGTYWPSDTVSIFGGNPTIMRSTDGGYTWGKPFVDSSTYLARIMYLTSLDRDTILGGGGDDFHYVMSTDRGTTWKIDSIRIDTNYKPYNCFGIQMLQDGHPIAIFGPVGSPALLSIIVRGEYEQSHVEVIERIIYYTYIYPNPSSGIVNIESIDKSGAPVYVTDILGREVKRSTLSSDGKLRLDLSFLPHGIYNVLLNHYGKTFSVGKVALTLQ